MNAIAQVRQDGGRPVDNELLDPMVISELSAVIPSERLIIFSEALRAGCHEAITELRATTTCFDQTAAIAHRLKGMVGNLGLGKLTEIAVNLETSETWSPEARSTAITEFEDRIEPSLAAFRFAIAK